MAGDAASGGAEPQNRGPYRGESSPAASALMPSGTEGRPQEPRLPVPWECHSPRQLPGTARAPQCVIRDPVTNKGGFRD